MLLSGAGNRSRKPELEPDPGQSWTGSTILLSGMLDKLAFQIFLAHQVQVLFMNNIQGLTRRAIVYINYKFQMHFD